MEAGIEGLATGALLGLAVSAAPGLNSVLCVGLARSGARRARPVILTAALTDCIYCLLSSLGPLAAPQLGVRALRWVSLVFLALSAVAIWPRRPRRPRDVRTLAIVASNPGTLAIWLGIRSIHGGPGQHDPQVIVAMALGALLATGCWFGGLACLSARLGECADWFTGQQVARAFSLALAVLALSRGFILSVR
jgi:threonine/homoserine/homoserine lactone efflux protein